MRPAEKLGVGDCVWFAVPQATELGADRKLMGGVLIWIKTDLC